tara:strand:+ start:239 stop:565 length:327 start_codon:yes stop_codon:yes gene_type:complete
MKTKYKPGDIVLVRSSAGPAIPNVHVKLIKVHFVKGAKGNTLDWPEFIWWEAELTKESEVKMLKKRFQIPYVWPSDVGTRVYDSDIIKKVRKNTSYRKKNYKRKRKTV